MELFGIHAVDRQRWPAFDIMKQVEEKRFYLYVANDAFESIYRRIYEPSLFETGSFLDNIICLARVSAACAASRAFRLSSENVS